MQPCLTTIPAPTTIPNKLYITDQGPLETETYQFIESPNCAFGFTTTVTNLPAFSTWTELSDASGKFTLESADPNYVGDYTVTVTATLNLNAFEEQFYIDTGKPTSNSFDYTIEVRCLAELDITPITD